MGELVNSELFTFTTWLERLEELALESGIALTLDLQAFEGQYRAGERPIDALETYIREHGT